MELELKSKEDLECMRRAGQIVAEVLQRLQDEVKPGVTTLDLDRIAEERRAARRRPRLQRTGGHARASGLALRLDQRGGRSRIPASRALKEGDIVGLDWRRRRGLFR
jgi:methionyl aminopeptidase